VENCKLPNKSLLNVTLPASFGCGATRERIARFSRTAQRCTVHLLVRIVVVATWQSSAAAFDAGQAFGVANLIACRAETLGIEVHEVGPNTCSARGAPLCCIPIQILRAHGERQ
jgi:hypothetical protein